MIKKEDSVAWENYRKYVMDILDNGKIYEHILSFHDWALTNPWYENNWEIQKILNEMSPYHRGFFVDISKLCRFLGHTCDGIGLKISKCNTKEFKFQVFSDYERMGKWYYKDGKVTGKYIREDIPFVDSIANPFFSEKFLEIAGIKLST